jgi:hypothetical protein
MPKDALREPMLWRAAHRKVRAKARQSGAEMSDRAPKVYFVLREEASGHSNGNIMDWKKNEVFHP